MGFEDRISQLCKKLAHLGYYQYQIRGIIKEAIGTTDLTAVSQRERAKIVDMLERYIRLGQEFLVSYSK